MTVWLGREVCVLWENRKRRRGARHSGRTSQYPMLYLWGRRWCHFLLAAPGIEKGAVLVILIVTRNFNDGCWCWGSPTQIISRKWPWRPFLGHLVHFPCGARLRTILCISCAMASRFKDHQVPKVICGHKAECRHKGGEFSFIFIFPLVSFWVQQHPVHLFED